MVSENSGGGNTRYGTRYIYNGNVIKIMENAAKKSKTERKYKTRWFYNKNIQMKNRVNEIKLRKCEHKRCNVCIIAEEDNCYTEDKNNPNFCKVFNCICKLKCKICSMS